MKSFNYRSLFYNLPFSYFVTTRMTGAKDWLFHIWNEWLISILIVCYSAYLSAGGGYVESIRNFLLAYAAFISFYEIGYIANDLYSVKKEKEPRLRFTRFTVGNAEAGMWIFFRVLVFGAISYYYAFPVVWLLFFFCLGCVFFLHNYLSSKALKTFTFIQLAFFRFWAPVFLFIAPPLFFHLVPVIFLFYVFNRTLTYMDSKGLLRLPERTVVSFRLSSNLILLFFSLFWSYYCASYVPFGVSVYFVFFWISISLVNKK